METPPVGNTSEFVAAVGLCGDTVAPRLLSALTPVYSEGVHRPEPVGTGILLRVSELIFILTAAHVIDDVGNGPRYFGAADQLLSLPEFCVRSPLTPGMTRDDDRVDLGFWVLSPEAAAKVGPSDPLSLSDLDLQDPTTIDRNADYFLNGYPASRQPRRIRRQEVEAHTLAFLTEECHDSEYAAANRDRRDHLLVDYSKDDFFSGLSKKTGPDLQGISGGAIWRLSGTSDVNHGRPVLSAVATRWRRDDPKCVIGTRVKAWVQYASREFPVQFLDELSMLESRGPSNTR